MMLEYTITDNHFESLIKYTQRNSRAYVKAMKSTTIKWFGIMAIIYFIADIIGWISQGGVGPDFDLWVKIVGFILYIITMTILFLVFKKISEYLLLAAYKKNGLYEDATGERRLITQEDSLRLESEIGVSELRYEALKKIIKTDQCLFLWRNQNVYIIVPLLAFPSPVELNEFLELLKIKTQVVFLQVGKNFVEHPLSSASAIQAG